MREIKFRVWDEENKQMWSWFEIEDFWESEGYCSTILRGDHWIPMQYTGLKDKKGIEIYEGDVVYNEQHPYLDGIIRFGEHQVDASDYETYSISIIGFYIEVFSQSWNNEALSSDNDLEIIGNIYANPELIGGKIEQ